MKSTEKTSMRIVSLLNSPASWAKVARKISCELENIFDFYYCEQKGFLYEEELFRRFPDQNIPEYDFELIIDHPNNLLKKKQAKISICHFVYEFEFLSPEWKKGLEKLDGIWVPNEFNKNILLKNKIKIPILVSPYGTDVCEGIYDFEKKYKTDVFLFRCIAMPQKRKGIRELVEAFEKEFSGKQDVVLQIKIPYNTQRSIWDINIQNVIRKSKSNIQFIDSIYTEEEIESFIKNAHVYIQPSYSEGFGLSVLDSLKMCVPVIVGEYGGHREFAREGSGSVILETKKMKMKGMLYSDKEMTTEVNVPSIRDLMKKMRRFYEDREYCIKLSEDCKKTDFNKYSWKQTSRAIKDFIMQLV